MRTERVRSLLGAIGVLGVGLAFAVGASAVATTSPSPSPSPSVTDYAQAIADQQAAIEAAKKEQEEKEAAYEYTQKEIVDANKRLESLEKQLPIAEAELAAAEDALQAALQQLREVEERLDAATAEEQRLADQVARDNARLEDLRNIVAEMARAAYRGERTDSTLSLVFGSSSTDDFVDQFTAQHAMYRTQGNALAEMEEIAAMNRNRSARQEAVKDYIAQLKVKADELVAEADAAREEAAQKKQEIDDLLAETEDLKAYLEAQRDQFLKDMDELAQQQDQMRDDLIDLILQSRGLGAGAFTGTWGYPVAHPVVVSSYGMRFHPIFHVWRLHAGTDFRAPCGTPILAAATGEVVWTKYRSGYGNQVLINHWERDGTSYMSSYNHLSAFAVTPGQIVVQGDVVAYAGTTGTSTGCHLHFEIYVNGNTVDPMTLLP